MRKSYRSYFQPKAEIKNFFINQQIKAPRLRVIDENGEMLGELSLFEALQKAQEAGLDLVEVSPKANPPVAKIMDYKQYRYQTEKYLRKQKVKQKKIETKGIRLSLRIGQHDLDTKTTQAKKFLADGNKIKVELILKGREKQMTATAREVIEKLLAELSKATPLVIEQPLTFMGGRFSVIVCKKSTA